MTDKQKLAEEYVEKARDFFSRLDMIAPFLEDDYCKDNLTDRERSLLMAAFLAGFDAGITKGQATFMKEARNYLREKAGDLDAEYLLEFLQELLVIKPEEK